MSKGIIIGVSTVVGVVGIVAYGRYRNKKAVEQFTSMAGEMYDAFQAASEESNENFDDASEMFNGVEHLFDECFLRN